MCVCACVWISWCSICVCIQSRRIIRRAFPFGMSWMTTSSVKGYMTAAWCYDCCYCHSNVRPNFKVFFFSHPCSFIILFFVAVASRTFVSPSIFFLYVTFLRNKYFQAQLKSIETGGKICWLFFRLCYADTRHLRIIVQNKQLRLLEGTKSDSSLKIKHGNEVTQPIKLPLPNLNTYDFWTKIPMIWHN